MKTLKSVLPKAAVFFVIFSILCGIVYTLVVTGLAQVFSTIRQTAVSSRSMERNTEANSWRSSLTMKIICGDVS